MKTAMDTMFKVGFGVDIDTLSGSDEIVINLSKHLMIPMSLYIGDTLMYSGKLKGFLTLAWKEI